MKVLYFHQHFSTPKGATGIRSYEMARRLVDRGHQVTIVCGSYKSGNTGLSQPFRAGCRRGIVDGFEVVEFDLVYANSDSFKKRALTFIRFSGQSVRLALMEKYDVLFATSTPLTAGIPGIFARWLRGKKFVFEVRDLWPELPRAMGAIRNPLILNMLTAMEWVIYHSSQRLVALSPGIMDGIARKGISREKIELIPNGCDLDIFAHCDVERNLGGIRDEDTVAIFSGTHGLANGLGALLDVAGELKKRGRENIKFLLIGDGLLKPSLIRRAKLENLDNVIFHDPVDKNQLSKIMSFANIGLQVLANVPAFYYGTSPNKFFDYLSAGLPVINNYPGWLAHIIKDHSCGIVVEPDNPVDFADALEWAADNHDHLLIMGARSRYLAETKYSRSELANLWVDWVING